MSQIYQDFNLRNDMTIQKALIKAGELRPSRSTIFHPAKKVDILGVDFNLRGADLLAGYIYSSVDLVADTTLTLPTSQVLYDYLEIYLKESDSSMQGISLAFTIDNVQGGAFDMILGFSAGVTFQGVGTEIPQGEVATFTLSVISRTKILISRTTSGDGATETLAQTLLAGNTTGGSDIVVSTSDQIAGEVNLELYAPNQLNLTSPVVNIKDNSSIYFTIPAPGSVRLGGGAINLTEIQGDAINILAEANVSIRALDQDISIRSESQDVDIRAQLELDLHGRNNFVLRSTDQASLVPSLITAPTLNIETSTELLMHTDGELTMETVVPVAGLVSPSPNFFMLSAGNVEFTQVESGLHQTTKPVFTQGVVGGTVNTEGHFFTVVLAADVLEGGEVNFIVQNLVALANTNCFVALSPECSVPGVSLSANVSGRLSGQISVNFRNIGTGDAVAPRLQVMIVS